MSTIDITLSETLRTFAEEEAKRRGYRDASAFVQSLVEAECARQTRKEVEELLLESVDGPFTEWTDQDLDDIRRTGERLIARRRRT